MIYYSILIFGKLNCVSDLQFKLYEVGSSDCFTQISQVLIFSNITNDE